MNQRSSCSHCSDSRSTTSTPDSRSQSIPPAKLTDSPTTTLGMPNWRTSPLQYQQGASVVTITVSRYLRRRPARRNASVSPCSDGSPSWTRRLWPRPSSSPEDVNSAAPIGMPPSAKPARASSSATSSISRSVIAAAAYGSDAERPHELIQLGGVARELAAGGRHLLGRSARLLGRGRHLLGRRAGLAGHVGDLLGGLGDAGDAVADLLDAGLEPVERRAGLLDGARGGLGELAHLVGHDREASALLAGAGGLDGRVEPQQVGLVGDRGDLAGQGDAVAGHLTRRESALDGVLRARAGGADERRLTLGAAGHAGGRLGDLADRHAGLLRAGRQLLRGAGHLRGERA